VNGRGVTGTAVRDLDCELRGPLLPWTARSFRSIEEPGVLVGEDDISG